MKLFPWQQNDSKSSKKTKTGGKKKKLESILDKTLVDQAKTDRDWALQLALQREGLTIEPPVEKQKKKLDEFITTKALERLQEEDSEFLDDVIKDKISTIITGSGRKRHRDESGGVYLEPGSNLSSALDDIETLEELKERIAGLQGGGGGGFFAGMNLKTLLESLPYVAALLGKEQLPTSEGIEGVQAQRTFIVRENGQDKEVSELEYRKMLQDGRVKPVGELGPTAPPKQEKPEEVVEEQAQNTIGQDQDAILTNFTEILSKLEPEVIGAYLDMSPDEFVLNLKSGCDTGIDLSRFLWGFFSNTTYEGAVNLLGAYKEDEKWNMVIERILSEEGKIWVEQVISLIKELQEGS